MIRKEKAEESKKSEQSGHLYNFLLQYVSKLKLKATKDRNLLQANLLAAKLDLGQLFNSKLQTQSVRPQNIVRFLEKAQKALQSIAKTSQELDPSVLMQNELGEKVISTQISLYVALHYLSEQNAVRQALVVLNDARFKVQDALEFAANNGLKGAQVQAMTDLLQKDVLSKVEFAMCKSQAKLLMQQHNQSKAEPMQIDSAPNTRRVDFQNLYDQAVKPETELVKVGANGTLNFLERGLVFAQNNQAQLDLGKFKVSKQFKLASVEPKLKSVQATP